MIRPYRPRQDASTSNDIALQSSKCDRAPLDPLLTLQVAMDHHTGSDTPMGAACSRSSISSVCFAPCQTAMQIDDSDSDSDSSSSSEPEFRCHSLLQAEARSASDPLREARQNSAATSLMLGRYLASCHASGDCILWDLNQRKIAQENLVEPRGPGWMLRRLEDTNQFFYQTRDLKGTVSIHSWEHPSTSVVSFTTFSQTFCAASPCQGNANLLALPSSNDSEAAIRDLRMDPFSKPVGVFSGSGEIEDDDNGPFGGRKHGMLTSLAFAECQSIPNRSTSSRPLVACGMESGTVFFHDLRRLGKPISMKLCDDPVLALDLAPSAGASKLGAVAIAGTAGENVTQQDLPASAQGTVGILKATWQDDESLRLRLRSRLSTCKPQGEGKPGVNLCRFQPGEGRLFAVAGWDQRVRIMDRSSNCKAPLKAILKGHDASVSAMDWAPDCESSGLCATAAADGKIHVWRCFSKPK